MHRINLKSQIATSNYSFIFTLMRKSRGLAIPDEVVVSKIYLIRDQKVMLDDDLADLYQIETRRLNEQVKRNIDRFPEDFMFRLTDEEWETLKSQNATSSWGGRRKMPSAFTEHGVLMLSSVLNSGRAIQVNIQIMRIYTKLKGMIVDHKDILLKLEKLEGKVSKHDESFRVVFDYLRELLNPKTEPMRKIGFKIKNKK
jgi:ORF6N domain